MRHLHFFTFLCFAFAATSALCSDLSAPQAMIEDDPPECSGVKASFEMDVNTGCAPLAVHFLNTSQGHVSCEYDFGDGNTLTGAYEENNQLSVHTFNNPSMYRDTTYYVTLRATSGVCEDEMTLAVEVLSSPIADFRPVNPYYPADSPYPAAPISLENLIPLPDRDQLAYLWSHTDACTDHANNFSDEIYPSPLNLPDWGTYHITQHVTAPNSICSDSKTLSINIILPVSLFDFEYEQSGCWPYEVTFSHFSRFGIVDQWDFGDGNTSNEEAPTHVYMNAGEYWVTLTVMEVDQCGVSTGLASNITKKATVHLCSNADSDISPSNPLKAWVRNELLHVTGLTKDEPLSIYTATGTLVHHSIATSNEAMIPLSVQGVYIVRSGSNTVKVVSGF